MKMHYFIGIVVGLLLITSAGISLGSMGNEKQEMKRDIGDNGKPVGDVGPAADMPVKHKTLYFHNQTSSIGDYNMSTRMGTSEKVFEKTTADVSNITYTLEPHFDSTFHIDGKLRSYIWIKITDSSGGTNKLNNVIMDVDEVDPAGTKVEDIVEHETGGIDDIPGHYYELTFNTADVEANISANNTLRYDLTINKPDSPRLYFAFGSDIYPTRVEVPTDTYVNVDQIRTLNSTYQANDTFKKEGDQTIYFNATVTDPFGGYDIWGVKVTVMKGNETIFYRRDMTKISGSYNSSSNVYSYAWDYTNASKGIYTVKISAIDRTGYNYRYPDHPGDESYGGHLVSSQKGFSIEVDMLKVYFQAVDSTAAPLEDAWIEVVDPSQDYMMGNTTNVEGKTALGVTSGNYTVRVYWQDVVVNETEFSFTTDISEENAIQMDCEVYDPRYVVTDNHNEPVGSAVLYIAHPNGTLMSMNTNENGEVDLDQMARGEYQVRTEWSGREVGSIEHTLNSNGDIPIDANIFYLTITTLDSQGKPISDVQVIIRYNDTQNIVVSKLTNNNGVLTSRLPGTQAGFGYNIQCKWHGVDVGQRSDVSLTSDDSIEFTLDIFYIEFHTVDQMDQDLENARLVAYNLQTERLESTTETDQTGHGTLRLPKGTHSIEASWKGIQVDQTEITVTEEEGGGIDGVVTLSCDVYHVTYHLVDSKNVALSNAKLNVHHPDAGLLASGTSDSSGNISMRLPGADVHMNVQWKDVTVFTGTRTVDSNGLVELQCNVYYLQMIAEDDVGQRLENANIQLIYGNEVMDSSTTDVNGVAPEMRVPEAVYTIEAYWKGVEVYSQPYQVTENGNHTITTQVYHDELEVTDNMGKEIGGAKISVLHDGRLLYSNTTDTSGVVNARLPQGTHQFRVEWRTVLVFDEPLAVTQSGQITLNAENVYHVNFKLLDSRDENVQDASVSLEINDVQFSSGKSNGTGTYFERIPTPVDDDGTVNVTAYWKGVNVYDEEVTISGNSLYQDPKELDVSVYYMDITLLDQKDKPLEDAIVIDTHQSLPEGKNIVAEHLTDSDGETTLRVPHGEQVLTTDWREVEINTREVNVDEDTELTLEGDVYYLNVDVDDAKGEPLAYSLLRVDYPSTGMLYQASHTDDSGKLQMRIPAQEWNIQVSWADTVVYDENYNVTSENSTWELDAQAQVYYLTVKTVDKNGEKLSDVQVILQKEEQTWSNYTKKGKTTFRLPASTEYKLTADYDTTYMMTEVDLTKNKQVSVQSTGEEKVKMSGYPKPFYATNLFMVIVGLIILLILLALAYRKLGEEETEEDEEEFEDEELEETEESEEEDIFASLGETEEEETEELEDEETEEEETEEEEMEEDQELEDDDEEIEEDELDEEEMEDEENEDAEEIDEEEDLDQEETTDEEDTDEDEALEDEEDEESTWI